MASNYTSNYGLCQWEPGDKVLRTEFNGDNAKIDAAVKAVDSRVTSVANSKASTSALNSLKSTVNSLSATVTGQGNTLAKKGNCQVVVTSYIGDGQLTRTHTFPRKPVMFFISGNAQMTIAYGCTLTYNHASSISAVGVSWSGNSVTLTSKSTSINMPALAIANFKDTVYQMVILYDQEE